MTRADTATSLEEKGKVAQDGRQPLTTAVGLDPTDPNATGQLQRAEQLYGEVSEARQAIDRAAAMSAQNSDSELSQARTMLAGLRAYASDQRYRAVVADLLTAHIERIEQ